MNINHLIKRIKDELGLSRYYKSSFTDHDIYKIIKEHALDEYGRYFKKEVELDRALLSTRIGADIMLIPDWVIQKVEKCGLRVEDIKSIRFNRTVVPDRTGLGQIVAYKMDSLSLESAYTGMYEMQRIAGSDIFQNYLNTCHFEKPNRIRFLWNNTLPEGAECTLSLWVSMSPNLIGVDTGREHTFYELCKLSVMTVIYQNESKYIESISSGLGNINLKVEDWQNAANERKELLYKMYNDSILMQNQIKII